MITKYYVKVKELMETILIIGFSALILISLFIFGTLFFVLKSTQASQQLISQLQIELNHIQHKNDQITKEIQQSTTEIHALKSQLEKQLTEQHHQLQYKLAEAQATQIKTIHDTLLQQMQDIRHQINLTLTQNTQSLNENITQLTQQTKKQLLEISGQVDKRLNDGFEKTSETFTKIVERLTIIDSAQKKITELSTNVVSLQEVLNDKRSRGAFGEVQLSGLLHNVLPSDAFILQHTLSNGKRADCLLKLPEPTGNIVIDAKFPLENYKKLTDVNLSTSDKKISEQNFKQDIRKHIKDISEKYILPDETSDGAIMFLPAESIFADLHAHYYDLVEFAQAAKVWLVSPTTMMAILTTARSVLKDVATRKQVHIIQKHLGMLSKDFTRFEDRMEKLAKHIQQANDDVDDVKKSATKISSRFTKIEKVQLAREEKVDDNVFLDD